MNFKLTKSSLNFKVYTSPTIPASGTENDIVIISSTPMENWILSSDAPTGEPRNNGDVWIQYSVSGNVFDIMNQHDFMLAITKIYQYVSGTWVSVDARRYVGGVWDVVSSAFSATINITYPANSNCVVANSSGQTVASDTNTGTSAKTWTATVGATGTYTITATATDGSGKTKSTTVSITADGQSKSVTLKYSLDIIVNGKFNYDVIGSWAASDSSSGLGSMVEHESDGYVQISAPQSTYTAWDSTKALPTSEYTTLYVDYSASLNGYSSQFLLIGGVSVSTNSSSYDARNTRAVDISGLTGNQVLTMIARAWAGNGGVSIYIYNMYLA